MNINPIYPTPYIPSGGHICPACSEWHFSMGGQFYSTTVTLTQPEYVGKHRAETD